MTHFLVTGCGRSGTTGVALLLSKLGIKTGHEKIFAPHKRSEWGDYEGDVSWFGVPFLGEVRQEDVRIVHLVRHPVDCGRSFAGFGFFLGTSDDASRGQFSRSIWNYDRSPYDWTDPNARFAAYWLRWNLAAELHAHVRVRIEDLRDPKIVATLLEAIGRPRPVADIAAAIESTDPRYNQRNRDETVTWESFPEPLRELVKITAVRYGYSPTTNWLREPVATDEVTPPKPKPSRRVRAQLRIRRPRRGRPGPR